MQLNSNAEVHITHVKPDESEAEMAYIGALAGQYRKCYAALCLQHMGTCDEQRSDIHLSGR